MALIQELMGPDNCAVISHHSEKNFPLERVPEKLIAIITECSEFDMDRETFKQISSGDPVRVARKAKEAQYVPFWRLPLLFGGNEFFKNMCDPDGAIERRVVVFAFLRRLRAGQGISDLMTRIFREEGATLVVKWNIMYLMMRSAIQGRSDHALPDTLRAAARQAVTTGDSLLSFFSQVLLVTRLPGDRMLWKDIIKQYRSWCRENDRPSYSVNVQGIEGQVLCHRFGIQLDPHCGIPTMIGVRLRRATDAPVENPFEIRYIERNNSDSLPPIFRFASAAAAAGSSSSLAVNNDDGAEDMDPEGQVQFEDEGEQQVAVHGREEDDDDDDEILASEREDEEEEEESSSTLLREPSWN